MGVCLPQAQYSVAVDGGIVVCFHDGPSVYIPAEVAARSNLLYEDLLPIACDELLL